MSDPSTEGAGGSGSAMSPPHRALWILGIALILAAVAGLAWAQFLYATNVGTSGTGSDPSFVVAQFLYFIAPGSLTGGIVCVALALAIAAVQRIVPRIVDPIREPGGEAAVPVPDIPGSAFRSVGGVAASTRQPPLDPEAFKRPRADPPAS